jgi:hypothetical protein
MLIVHAKQHYLNPMKRLLARSWTIYVLQAKGLFFSMTILRTHQLQGKIGICAECAKTGEVVTRTVNSLVRNI